jgi:hypothetical protein
MPMSSIRMTVENCCVGAYNKHRLYSYFWKGDAGGKVLFESECRVCYGVRFFVEMPATYEVAGISWNLFHLHLPCQPQTCHQTDHPGQRYVADHITNRRIQRIHRAERCFNHLDSSKAIY